MQACDGMLVVAISVVELVVLHTFYMVFKYSNVMHLSVTFLGYDLRRCLCHNIQAGIRRASIS